MSLKHASHASVLLFLSAVLMSFAGRSACADEWLAPIEQYPMVGNCIYNRVQPGRVYVSLGTERAFMGAARTKAAALYVIDPHPGAITFAQINRALIAASANAGEYRHLRIEASADEWVAAAGKLTDADSEYKSALTDPDSWNWWNKYVRQNDDEGGGYKLLATQPSAQPDPEKEPFTGFNYLWDETLFQNLKALTTAHMIWAEQTGNFTHIDDLSKMISWVRSNSLAFGVIDSSDLPDPLQSNLAESASYFSYLSAYVDPDTIFLNTETGTGEVSDDFSVWWSYYGFEATQINNLYLDDLITKFGNEIKTVWQLGSQSQYGCRFNSVQDAKIWTEPPNGPLTFFSAAGGGEQ